MAQNETIVISVKKTAATNNSRNWSRYNVLLTGILLVVVLVLDSLVIYYILRFVEETYTKGSEIIIRILWIIKYRLCVYWNTLGSLNFSVCNGH